MSQSAAPVSAQTIIATNVSWSVLPPATQPSAVRQFLLLSLSELLGREDADRVGIAAHELIENILKYSDGGTSRFDLTLTRRGDEGRVILRTENRITPERLREAEALIGRIGRAPDPSIVYDELVATSPARSGSGLGLARIRVEADMAVECFVVDWVFTIVAEGRVSLQGRPSC